jgi:ribosomal protein S12 methylthiotransferase accessory factor
LTRVEIEIQLPAGVPEKYRAAVARAAEQCLVKRQLERPPAFEISTVEAPLAAMSEAGAGAR